MKITDETIEAACEAFYNDPSGLTSWARTSQVSPTMANRYRAAMTRAFEAAAPHILANAWDEGMEAMYATTSSEWPTIPEANPYRPTP